MAIMRRYISSVGYSFASLSTTIMNKYILSILEYNKPFLLVALQSILICTFVLLGVLLNVCHIKLRNIKKWLIPSLFLNIMIFTGTKTLQHLPISLFTLFKNGSIIVVSLIEFYLFSRRISSLEFISFVLMILSSYIGDISGHVATVGYIWTIANILSATVYVISLRYVIKYKNSSTAESIFFPNLIAIPMIGLLSSIFETQNIPSKNPLLIYFIVLSSICALLTALSTSYVLKYLSSTTFSMIGAFNKILMGFSGLIFLSESLNHLKLFSLILGSFSSILYVNSLRYKKMIN